MAFDGTALGLYDQLDVQGLFAAGGTLVLTLDASYPPAPGNRFTPFNGTTPGFDSGSFVISNNLGDGLAWDTSALGSLGVITGPFPPVPASLCRWDNPQSRESMLARLRKIVIFWNLMNAKLLARITVDSRIMSGHPCIRGMRVTVSNILRLLAAHHDSGRILKAYPYLEAEDIDACLEYAALLANEREVELVA